MLTPRSSAENVFRVEASFDANLSPKLVKRLADLFPDSGHVFASGLGRSASDETIWNYAAVNSFAIVTTDSDFVAMAERLGPPPQVIRLKNWNYKTARVAELLRRNAIRIAELVLSDRPMLIVRNVL